MGGKSTTSTSTVSIPPEVLARYNAVNAKAEQVAATPFQAYGGQFVAPINPTQQAGIEATSQYSQAAQPYYGAATGLALAGAAPVNPQNLQVGRYMNPYTGYVAGATQQALGQQQGQQLSQQQAEAIRAGAFGGDRAGIQRAVLQGQQGLATAQAIAPIYQQGYQQALGAAQQQQGVNLQAQQANRQALQQAGQQIAGLGTGAQQAALQGAQAQIGAGTLAQQTQQAQDTAQYQQFLQERGYPFQVAQFLANIAMGTGALSGSTTTTTQPSSFFSDERLKENIKKIGETNDGQPIYKYNYKGDHRTQIGLLAQDVEKQHPDAVGQSHGYKTVDYDRATEDAEQRPHRGYGGGLDPMNSMGGAVTPMTIGEAFARGGYALSGSVLEPTDLQALLQANKEMYQKTPFGGAAFQRIGGGQNPMGGTSIVPPANLPVARQALAKAPGAPPPSGFKQMVGDINSAQGFYDTFAGEKGIFGEKGVGTAIGKKLGLTGSTPPATGGQNQASGVAAGKPATAPAGGVAAAAAKPTSAPNQAVDTAKPLQQRADIDPNIIPQDTSVMVAAHGGFIHRRGYATDGGGGLGAGVSNENDIIPGMSGGEDPLADVVQSGKQQIHNLQTPGGGAGGQQGGGLGSALMQGASMLGAANTLGNAGSWLATKLPMLFLAHGGVVPRHHYATDGGVDDDPNRADVPSEAIDSDILKSGSQHGNLAVAQPPAGGSGGGSSGLGDAAKAAQAIANIAGMFLAHGGVVPRPHFQTGGGETEDVVPANYSEEADLPSIRAQEAQAQAAFDHRATVANAAKEAGIDVNHAMRLVQGESGFKPTPGDDGSSGSVWQLHIGGISDKYPNAGKGNEFFAQARPDLDKTLTPQEKIKWLNDDRNQAEISKWVAPEIAKNGAAPWTQARVQGLFGLNREGGAPSGGLGAPTAEKSWALRNLPTTTTPEGKEEVNVKQLLIPGLIGLGQMAASPSRYLGSAVLQGLGAGAQAYATLEKQQADTDAVKAGIPGIALESAQKAIFVDPNGETWINVNGKWLNKASWIEAGSPQSTGSAMGDYYVKRLFGSGVAGEKPTEQKAGTTQVAGPSGGPAAPAAPKAPSLYDLTDANKINALSEGQKIAAEEAKNVRSQDYRGARDQLIAENQAVLSAARKQMQDAQTIKPSLNQVATPLATLAAGQEITAGALAPLQQGVVKIANAALEKIGLPPFALEGMTAATVADKASEMLAQAKTLGLDQRAYSALERVANTVPNKNMNKEAFADILATSYIDNYRAQHEGSYTLKYGQGQTVPIGRRSTEAYRADHPELDRQFNTEKMAIKDLLLTKVPIGDGKYEPLLNYLLGQGKDPELRSKITPELINKKYGVNVAKYFTN